MSKFLGRSLAAGFGAFIATIAATWVLAGAAGATSLTAPTISGSPQAGQNLTAIPGTPGPSTDTFDAPTYQWLVCTATCANGPTGPTFPLASAEVGATIKVAETINDNAVGATQPNPVTTTSAAIVVPAPPPNPAPTIAGTVQQGQTLTASPGVWSGTPTAYHYVWTRGVTAVGTDSPTYVPTVADVGQTIAVTVSAAYSAGTYSASPVSVGPVLPLPPGNLTPPMISGTPQQGQVLTVTQGTWSNSPALSDVWEDCTALICTAIPGQTGATYTVGAGDVGHTIEVVETASNTAPAPTNVVSVPSSRTATVLATSATSVVAYSQNAPSANQPITLVAAVTSGSGNATPHGSLSFFNGSNAISGCANKGITGGQTVTIVCQASFGAGQAQISAAYVADPTSLVAGSTSDTTSVAIGQGSTSISLAVTPKVAPRGRATYLATLGVPLSNAGPVLPTGSIEFLDGGQPIAACASQPLTNLTATCSVRYPVAGQHSITARYDGDSNFTSSTSSASNVQVVKGAPKAPVVRGTLGSTLGWRIVFHPHYSSISELTLYAVPKGTTIFVQCFGKGCPFAKWRLTKAAGTINLQRHFRHRHLRAGDRITVRLSRKNWVGKYYSFTIRAGHKPKITTTCLAPGKFRPAIVCPSS